MESKSNAYTATLFFLTFGVPVFVLPNVLDNAFNAPKNLLIVLGAALMLFLYTYQYLRGDPLPVSSAATPKILIFLILLNFFSFLYTANYYFTIVAAVMNIMCLLIFHFVSLYVDGRRAPWLLVIIAFSGVLVSVDTYLQFTGHFLLIKWAYKGIMVMGTIGNSNYLGAYLMFPLYALAALIFLLKGRYRLIPTGLLIFVMGAFLFSRARAGWFGFFLSVPVFVLLVKKIHRLSLWNYLKANPLQVLTHTIVLLAVCVSLWYAAPKRFHIQMGFRTVTNSETLRLRMAKYYAASRWLFKQNPLFGTGLWSFRNLVYTAQAEINQVDKEYFKDYPEPKPRRVHTEYLEILNDGGLLAAAALSLFLIVVMRHGWLVIRDEGIATPERIMAATGFCALIAVLLNALFFFPFRINSTMFMTVLMMGLMEALYLRNRGLVAECRSRRKGVWPLSVLLITLVLVGAVWFTGIKPFWGEVEHFKYKKALAQGKVKEAETHILKALEYDPHNTAYLLYTSQLYMNTLKDFGRARDYIEMAITDYNGDITRWSIFFIKGLLRFQMGNLFDAQAAFEKSLYYNPTFEPAEQKLAEVKKVIKDHDRVLIKLR